MGLYKNNNGVLSPIAGRGKAEYGASTVRKGTATYTGEAYGSYPAINVTFDTPMPDADYEIFFDYDRAEGHGELSYMGLFGVYKRTANGFQIVFSSLATISSGWNIKYTAFKLYTDNEYNGLLNNQRYSTDEIDTGKTWIDGKKIYRKVVDCGALPNNTQKTVNHGISNLGEVTSIVGMSKYLSAGISIPLPYVGANNVYLYVSATGVVITTTSDLSSYTATKVIIEYTKTT